MKTYRVFLLLLLGACSAPAHESVYTELSEAQCKLIEQDEETGSTRELCPGIEGYRLAVLSDDNRVSIDVISPDGQQHPLHFWDVISGRFTSHGEKAEWRVARKSGKSVPMALIVRVNAFEDDADPGKSTSYLAVARLSKTPICVTARIAPGPKQNEEARIAADATANKPCLGKLSP